MPSEPKTHFYTEVGEHPGAKDMYFDEGEAPDADGLFWFQRGSVTDSFPEVEARGIMLSKTYKHVRLMQRTTEVLAYVEE